MSKSKFFTSVNLLLLATVMFSSLSIGVRAARSDKPILKRNLSLWNFNKPNQQNDKLDRQVQINVTSERSVLSNDPNNNPNATNLSNPNDPKQKLGTYDPNSFKTNQFENTPSGSYSVQFNIPLPSR
ncbi:MAG: hypothetical protein RLZZ135_1626 [Cyanobacteriota bacterium]|jgi:hypothetical protein